MTIYDDVIEKMKAEMDNDCRTLEIIQLGLERQINAVKELYERIENRGTELDEIILKKEDEMYDDTAKQIEQEKTK